jgi:hypothetical protein
MEAHMSVFMPVFMNWTSRVAIAGRVPQLRRLSRGSNELMIPRDCHWDYHLPFGKSEARPKPVRKP